MDEVRIAIHLLGAADEIGQIVGCGFFAIGIHGLVGEEFLYGAAAKCHVSRHAEEAADQREVVH